METYRRELGFKTRIRTLFNKYFLLLAAYRFGRAASWTRNPFKRFLLLLIHHPFKLIMSIWCSSDIYSRAVIGRRFVIHTSRALLIADDVVFGDDCIVNNGVCVVNKANNRNEGVPRIGNNVRVGVGAKIMGGITIGDNVIVGANTVVLKDVPSNHLAVGVPAVLKSRIMNMTNLNPMEEKTQGTGEISPSPPEGEAASSQG
jgi:serine O-acetyltransferase